MTRNPITRVVVKVKVKKQLSLFFPPEMNLSKCICLNIFDQMYFSKCICQIVFVKLYLSKCIFFVSLHLSDQMSQRSEVSRIAL